MRIIKLLACTFLLILNSLPASAALSPDEAIARLHEGNNRYVTAKSAYPRIDPERRRSLAINGQAPIAAVLGCADSRVPPEIVFDQSIGDLFVVRVAGNVCGSLDLASLEYAVAKLHVPLIVVLGHTQCGAVEAAMAEKPLPGSLPELMKMITPAVEKAEASSDGNKDALLKAIEQNVIDTQQNMEQQSSIIRSAIEDKSLKVVGGVCHIKEGAVEWLGEVPPSATH